MNRFLADAIGTINAIAAWALIIVPPIAGGISQGTEGFIVGLILGLILAVVLCGMLALLIDIRDSLREIAGSENQESIKGKPWEHT